jgi:hypothetical protein
LGYDLHITRRTSWSDEGGREISEREWAELIASDTELEPLPSMGPTAALWKGHSTLDEPWLMLERGNIDTKNPDDALIDKMVQIAHTLGAVVQGDDGETYPLAPRPGQAAAPESRPRGKGLFARLGEIFGGTSEVTTPAGVVLRKGARVREVIGDRHVGTIVAIDPDANMGMGTVTVRLDDGRVVTHSVIAPGIDPVEGPPA